LIQTPFDVWVQSIAEILVHHRQVEPFRAEVATAPPDLFDIFLLLPISDDLQEPTSD
jgi:hypothetical protein